jgi:small subunit ribosomal protein S5
LHHDVKGKSGAGKVILRSAPAGTGIIAGGAVRAICEMSGIQDVVGKSIGSANPYNVVRASFAALSSQQTPKDISLIRGKKIKDIVSRR